MITQQVVGYLSQILFLNPYLLSRPMGKKILKQLHHYLVNRCTCGVRCLMISTALKSFEIFTSQYKKPRCARYLLLEFSFIVECILTQKRVIRQCLTWGRVSYICNHLLITSHQQLVFTEKSRWLRLPNSSQLLVVNFSKETQQVTSTLAGYKWLTFLKAKASYQQQTFLRSISYLLKTGYY